MRIFSNIFILDLNPHVVLSKSKIAVANCKVINNSKVQDFTSLTEQVKKIVSMDS